MENLIIIHKGQMISKRIVGGIIFICGIILIITNKDHLNFKYWLESIVFLVIGVVNFTSLSGSYKSEIFVSERSMTIKWRGWIRKIIVQDSEIENITLLANYFLIKRKGKKAIKVFLDSMGKEQKTKIFEFLINYAKQKNLVLVR